MQENCNTRLQHVRGRYFLHLFSRFIRCIIIYGQLQCNMYCCRTVSFLISIVHYFNPFLSLLLFCWRVSSLFKSSFSILFRLHRCFAAGCLFQPCLFYVQVIILPVCVEQLKKLSLIISNRTAICSHKKL